MKWLLVKAIKRNISTKFIMIGTIRSRSLLLLAWHDGFSHYFNTNKIISSAPSSSHGLDPTTIKQRTSFYLITLTFYILFFFHNKSSKSKCIIFIHQTLIQPLFWHFTYQFRSSFNWGVNPHQSTMTTVNDFRVYNF